MEIHAVIWRDLMLGNLSLPRATPAEAIALAQSIRAKGSAMVEGVRAVTLHPDDRLDVIDGAPL